MPQIAVTGSIAYDTIMVFPGHFAEHILADHAHMISVSFLVDRLERRRGGTAGNIAYTLGLLGQQPLLCAAVGDDFHDYASALRAVGVDTGTALACDDITCATCFITTDLDDNQITAFFPGAMARAGELDLRTVAPGAEYVVVAPDDPKAMHAHVLQAAEMGARVVFSPSQQLPSIDKETLCDGLQAAWLLVGNDYELEMIQNRTGSDPRKLAERGAIVAVTLGAAGSELYTAGVEPLHIPAAPADAIVDPTGAGDAYIAGLLSGLAQGRDLATAGRMGSLAATYCVEQNGPQGHVYTAESFAVRYAAVFEGTAAG